MSIRQTSIEAYRQIEAEGLLTSLRFECYKILYKHGPATACELITHTKETEPHRSYSYLDSIAKRLSELREQGVARELGKRHCKITGRVAIEWDVTDALPVEYERKKPLSERHRLLVKYCKELEQENAMLRNEFNKTVREYQLDMFA